MDKELIHGQMKIYMKEIGKIIEKMVLEHFIMPMEELIQVNGLMI